MAIHSRLALFQRVLTISKARDGYLANLLSELTYRLFAASELAKHLPKIVAK